MLFTTRPNSTILNKKLATTLTLNFKNIIDDSLITGTIPNLLKNAIITPIIKNLILTLLNSQIIDLYLNYLY